MAIDVVKEARVILEDRNSYYDRTVAFARVILAASERVKHGHSVECNVIVPSHLSIKPCTCGHDALMKALRGGV